MECDTVYTCVGTGTKFRGAKVTGCAWGTSPVLVTTLLVTGTTVWLGSLLVLVRGALLELVRGALFVLVLTALPVLV